ncbi:MAG: response regulator [Proteobacteria bacterium]|nr:response regulator [Pseudomonadota bacterium]
MSALAGTDLRTFESCGRTMRPLFVTNDSVLSAFAKVHLASDAHDVITATSGEEARDKLLEGPFNVILIDLAFARSAGFTLLERLRSEPLTEYTPIIVGTEREDVTEVERAFDLGATAFFTKPVNWRLLAFQIRLVWRAHELQEARRQAEIEAVTRGVMRDSASLLTEAMHGSEALRAKAREYANALAKLSEPRHAHRVG